jgi:hypothetical protein
MASIQDRPPPTTAAIAMACALIAGVTGYFIGQASTIGFFGGIQRAKPSVSKDEIEDSDSSSNGDAGEEMEDGQELKSFTGNNEECKLVLVVRTDLGMTKGTSIPLSSTVFALCCIQLLCAPWYASRV